MRRPALRIGASSLLLAGALLAGCSPQPKSLARVGHQIVTVEDFEDAGRGNEAQYVGPPEKARSTLMEDLLRRALLVEVAHRRGFDTLSTTRQFRRAIEERELSKEMVTRLTGTRFPVTDAEIAEFYGWRGTESHAFVIFTRDRPACEQAMGRIRAGESFPRVADLTNMPGIVPPGGDVGWLAPGALIAPLDDLLRTAPLGRTLGPLESSAGWFLFKVTERRPRVQPPLETQRSMLLEMLRQRKQRAAMTRAVDDLRHAWHLEPEPGGSQVVFQKFSAMRAPQLSAMGGQVLPPTLTPAERGIVLARYDAWHGDPGLYTLADAFDDLDRGDRGRPNVAMLPSITQWIDDQCVARLVVLEARRRHLDEEPGPARRIRQQMDNHMMETVYNEYVMTAPVTVPPAELRAGYERNRESFARLAGAHLLYTMIRDSTAAAAVMTHADAPTLREAVALGAPGTEVKEQALKFPTKDPLWSQFEGGLGLMSKGEYRGPMPWQGRWLIVQVLSKETAIIPFEQLAQPLLTNLQREAEEMHRAARFSDLTDSLRRVITPIEVDRVRLNRVPWPVPPEPAPA